ncbi:MULTISPECIES: class E sortase [unclassified Corynebacterium]|uniref:class E sortase n=1 Tax=unclassified Corynebacterium TaxID=2624378 RepID=UPI001C490FBF|nr:MULTISPECIES: class E sortase [unclassified Corynebacterium]MBV7282224.1 class E sortase [Corynebacterium sp. TAE3-ERU30]MBV7302435.1 class E sortase [Corynebacterium sp. TAE3-ERU2]
MSAPVPESGRPVQAPRRPRPGCHRAPRSHGPGVVQILGELLLTIGVLILLFAYYEAYWTNLEAGKKQAAANEELDHQWSNPRQKKVPELGDAFARMYVPSFGSDYHFAILEGTDDHTLLSGPGRYTETEMPGEAGNFAIAGHRVGKGAPFNDLGKLNTCDAVVVETQDTWEVYRVLPMGDGDQRTDCFTPEQRQRIVSGDYHSVYGRTITTPTNVSVLETIPGVTDDDPDALNAEALMTMTTCHPQFSNAERMIIHAMQVAHYDKQGGFTPPELEER